MTAEELMRMTVKDLRALAERHGVAGSGRMRKDQLIGDLLPLIQLATKPAPAAVTAKPAGSSQMGSTTAVRPPALHQGPDPGLPIPESYGLDRLVLLVQDPHHIFAYWEVTATTYAQVATQAGPGATTVLLLHTPSGVEQREIDLRGGNYYLSVAPGATYRAEVALRGRNGKLYALAISNFVQTPAAGPSQRTDTTWMEVDETFHELLALAGIQGQDTGSLARLNARAVSATVSGKIVSGEAADLAAGTLSSAALSRRTAAHMAEVMASPRLSSTALSSTALQSPAKR
jgi:hypothetical protein